MLDLAFQELDILRARLALILIRKRQHFIRHVEPVSLARGPDPRFAESNTSIPPPVSRSRTISPGFNFANAVGFPHPNEASIASSGTWPAWEESYNSR